MTTQNDDQNADNASNGDAGGDDARNANQNASGDAGTSNDTSSIDRSGDDNVSRAELDNALKRMKAADQRADGLQAKLKEWEDKDKSDLEKAQGTVQELTAERDQLADRVRTMAFENAFLTDNKYTWHDSRDALRLLDMDGVEVKDDGTVVGLKPAIEKLAKAKPHLIKQNDGGSGNSSSAASGTANNGTRKGSKTDPPKDYSSRFPALRTTNKQS
ncbi:MAG: hypothetical protein AB7L09_22175 [Nitrospira sp.]